jgi:hypothetical protein
MIKKQVCRHDLFMAFTILLTAPFACQSLSFVLVYFAGCRTHTAHTHETPRPIVQDFFTLCEMYTEVVGLFQSVNKKRLEDWGVTDMCGTLPLCTYMAPCLHTHVPRRPHVPPSCPHDLTASLLALPPPISTPVFSLRFMLALPPST